MTSRLLRVLGVGGWVSWTFIRRDARSSTLALDFEGELEDFDVC